MLPLFPAVRDYQGWLTGLRELGVAHVARALLPPAAIDSPPAFRVLDGLWYPAPGWDRWRRVDRGYLAELAVAWRAVADPRRPAALALLDRADALLDRDPMGLRRLTLYQLSVLLHEGGALGADAVRRLGVHDREAAELAAALADWGGGAGVDREAAEGVLDAWLERRLTQVAAFLDRLPERPADQLLDRLRRLHEADSAELERLLLEAGRSAASGQFDQAARHCLRAARLDRDDQRPVAELVRVCGLAGPPSGERLVRARPTEQGVRVSWQPAGGRPADGAEVRYRVLRQSAEDRARLVELGVVGQAELLDRGAAFGSTVRYAVIPVAAGRPVGPARLSRPGPVAPPVSALTLTPGRRRVALDWSVPAAAVAVRAARTALSGSTGPAAAPTVLPLGADRAGLLDEDLEPGRYRYTVACAYRTPDARQIWSEPVAAEVLVEEYPDPVGELTLHPADSRGTVRISWTPPEHGAARLVRWPDQQAPAPGTDLTDRLADLPPAVAPAVPVETGPAAARLVQVELPPPTADCWRLTAVTTHGRRAVAGATLLLDAPAAVTDLAAERRTDGQLRLSFGWPDPALQVDVAWTQGGQRRTRRVARSSYLREGLLLPADDRACLVTVAAVAHPRADLVLTGPAALRLPPCVRIAWTVERPKPWSAARYRVRITVLAPPAQAPGQSPRCPDFLLVAGEGRLRPLRPEQGRELLRVAGSQLAAEHSHLAQLDLRRLARPAVLRAFLIGPHAPDARLQDPAPDALVVR